MLNEPQFFYELYVRSTKDSFIDVPVAISGYLDKGSNRLNQDPLDTGKLVFVRRFTLVDTLSGIENAEGETVSTLTSKNPKYIRYISKATFYIKPTSTETIAFSSLICSSSTQRRRQGQSLPKEATLKLG